MSTQTPQTPHEALVTAASRYKTHAEFARQLAAQSGRYIPRNMISTWLLRRRGAPEYICPDIEFLTGIPCEVLQPATHWHILRNSWMRAATVPDATDVRCDDVALVADGVQPVQTPSLLRRKKSYTKRDVSTSCGDNGGAASHA